MSWIGGKKALRELIVRLFPLYYERYIEVFGGGGWVLFHKPPGNDFEVYNDFNGLLVNLYRCVRDKPEKLMEALRYVLNAREDFDRIRSALARDSPASDVQRAAWFYQLIRYSYASGLTSFGSQPHDMRSNFPLIEQAHRRLAKVVIENKDFEKLLRQYDRPVSFFYLDPPYHATEGYYQNIGEDGFTEADHIRLRDALMRIEGKFLLSYNDDAFVRGLYDRPGIYLMETTRILERLGVPVSVLIDSLYRQIIMTNSIPYSFSVPTLPARDAMSVEQFDDMMKKGLDQARAGQGMELDAAFEQISKSI